MITHPKTVKNCIFVVRVQDTPTWESSKKAQKGPLQTLEFEYYLIGAKNSTGNKESRRNWGWKHKKPYNSRTAYVSELCNSSKFPQKRHLSNGSWTKTVPPPTQAKNRKNPWLENRLRHQNLFYTKI